jgi:hypothetical protein
MPSGSSSLPKRLRLSRSDRRPAAIQSGGASPAERSFPRPRFILPKRPRAGDAYGNENFVPNFVPNSAEMTRAHTSSGIRKAP